MDRNLNQHMNNTEKTQQAKCAELLEKLSEYDKDQYGLQELMDCVRAYVILWNVVSKDKDVQSISILKQFQTKFSTIFLTSSHRKLSKKEEVFFLLTFIHPVVPYRMMVLIKWLRSRRKYAKIYAQFLSHKRDRLGLTNEAYSAEYKKYLNCAKEDDTPELSQQINEFFTRDFECLTNLALFSEKSYIPTVVCVVKDEKDRMRLFYKHYRKLGVKQFVMLDNNSSDGTCEYLRNQPDTHVYRVKEPFETQKKTAWIERLLALEGYSKWYIVVDSDELLDYPGSEKFGIETFINRLETNGYKRAWGIMLDMYSPMDLFSEDCDILSIPEKFSYFDNDSYIMRHSSTKIGDEIIGGPRFRLWGTKMLQSKQSVFYFSPDILYRNCHFLYPEIGWEDAPLCFVLRHYKFLKRDESEYRRRVANKNFYNNSSEYLMQMEAIENGAHCMYYEGSIHYDDSCSLLKIPFLTDIMAIQRCHQDCCYAVCGSICRQFNDCCTMADDDAL